MIETKDPFSFLFHFSNVIEGHYGPAIQTFGIVVLVLIGNFLFKKVLSSLRQRYEKRQRVWALSCVSALEKPVVYYVWLVTFVCSLDIITFSVFSFHLQNLHLILSIGAIVFFGWFLMRWNVKAAHYGIEMCQSNQLAYSANKLDLISKVATIGIIFVTIFLLLDVTGHNMHTLLAFGGIGGLALAFASQQVVANFFGGVMVYLTHPFSLGERIKLPEKNIEGYIEEIGWYLTRIRNMEKRPIYVPNSIFTQSIVVTPSRMSHERFNHTIGLRYSDIAVVKNVVDNIKLMLLKHPYIDQHVKIEVYFVSFGASTLDISISAYMAVSSGGDFPSVRQDILLKIAEIVAEQGAEMATPTQIIEIQGLAPSQVKSTVATSS